MKTTEVSVVRIYLNEGAGQLSSLLKRLRDWEHVQGVTVFRGVAGFGPDGELHTGKLLDLSLELPLVVEFFDAPDKVAATLDHLAGEFKPGHILTWSARTNL